MSEVENNDDKSKIMQSLGDIYFFIGWYDDAITVYTDVIELTPEIAGVWRNLGEISDNYNHEKAIEYLQKSLDLEKDSKTYSTLGGEYVAIEKLILAEKAFICNIQMDSRDHFAWYELAKLYGIKKQTDKCLECLKNAIKYSHLEYQQFARNESEFRYLKDHPEFVAITTDPNEANWSTERSQF